MNKAKAEELGLSWLVEIGAHGVVAGPDSTLQSQPANAIKKAIAKEGISIDQLDVIEINEAFSAVALASTKELGLDRRQGQRQRRRDRHRPPDRHVGRPDHPARRPRAGPTRLGLRRGRPVRRGWAGRRADPAAPLTSLAPGSANDAV